MRKFLLFRVEKNGKLELIDVWYSSMLESIDGQINKVIKQDLLLMPGMRKCCVNSLIGECTDYESYIEHKAYGYIYPLLIKPLQLSMLYTKSLCKYD